MSRICLLCHENETPDGHHQICDPCYDDPHRTPPQDIVVPGAVTAPRSAHLAHLHDDGIGA